MDLVYTTNRIATRPTCAYAVRWFAAHPVQADLLQTND